MITLLWIVVGVLAALLIISNVCLSARIDGLGQELGRFNWTVKTLRDKCIYLKDEQDRLYEKIREADKRQEDTME
jgi:hypothetical protein